MKPRFNLILILACFGPLALLHGQGNEHWVATWTTAQPLARYMNARTGTPQPAAGQSAARPQPPPAAPGQPTAAERQAFAAQQAIAAQGFSNQTIRMIVRTSIGGSRVRVKLANAFDSQPLAVGAAHIAIRGKDSEIAPGSDRLLTFNGKPSCTIGPGVVILSDPVDLKISPLGDIAVSLYFPGKTGPPTAHNGLHTTYVSKEGDFSGQPAISDATTTQSYYWLAGMDVLAAPEASLVVALGDSITESFRSTPDTNRSWPALLSARFASNASTANLAVANMGIGGNRMLRDGTGASALARFDRDVLSQSGVKWLIVLEGINDIGRGATDAAEVVSSEDLIAAYEQIIERAHTFGIKVMGGTLPPYEGASYARESGEAVREAVNTWIRTSGAYDGVIDFEAATRDRDDPKRLRPEFDPGDHLHPNDAGYQAMADAVDLSLFGGSRAAPKSGKRSK
jgi:lysophospholipase L1-like esterase